MISAGIHANPAANDCRLLRLITVIRFPRSHIEVNCAEFERYEWKPFVDISDRTLRLQVEYEDGELDLPGVEDLPTELRDRLIEAIRQAGIPQRLRTTFDGDVLIGIGFPDPSGTLFVSDCWPD